MFFFREGAEVVQMELDFPLQSSSNFFVNLDEGGVEFVFLFVF